MRYSWRIVYKISNHNNGTAVKAVYNLLQHRNKVTMSDFNISFNLFGEYDNFDDWDAAEEKEINNRKRKQRHKELTDVHCLHVSFK